MRSRAAVLTALAAAGLGAGAQGGCGSNDSFAPWWDGDKSAHVPFPNGPAHTDAGKNPRDASAIVEAGAAEAEAAAPPAPIQTVFFVLMSAQAWSAVAGSKSAPYINGTLLPSGAHSEAYFAAPPKLAASEPNVLWLEGGQDFGFVNNNPPTTNHTSSTKHLVDQLEAAGVTWKAYVDRATAGVCPIVDMVPLRAYNVPFVYFDDVVGNPPSPAAKRCVQHVVPFAQLATDLAKQTVPRYAFIVPDACNDMHDDCNTGDPVKQGDDWLAAAVPPILASKAYAAGGAVLIAWDFTGAGYVPLGFIALSPKARAGFAGKTTLTPSSTLRSLQEIFGVTPLLGDAANATDIGELFTSFP